jgi:hypothetical protein
MGDTGAQRQAVDPHPAASPARLTLAPVAGAYAVCRLEPDAPRPAWAAGGLFTSITRTADEVSVVCEQSAVPPGVQSEPGWRCLRVAGTLDFAQVGVLAGLVDPLAAAVVSVFVVSTFHTDYLLVKEGDLQRALAVLRQHGHTVED